MLVGMIPFIGASAHDTSERMVTIPQNDIRNMCKDMSEEDKNEAVRLGHVMADSISDFLVFVASRGKINAD